MNLLINAQKFTTAGGTITVEVELPSVANSEEITVSVTDTGTGIAKKEQEKQILYWIEKGYTNKEIANKLHLKEGTIKVYNHIIFQKLNVKNRTQAIVRAKEGNLI